MENREAFAETLNDLVQINNDRIVGYEKAMHELKDEDADLKALFVDMIHESHNIKMALSTELNVLGTKTDSGTTSIGKIYRVWMDVKAALTGKDRKAILNSCEYGEDQAKDTYEKALENEKEHLSMEQQTMIKAQHALLRVDHDKVKSMRDLAMAD